MLRTIAVEWQLHGGYISLFSLLLCMFKIFYDRSFKRWDLLFSIAFCASCGFILIFSYTENAKKRSAKNIVHATTTFSSTWKNAGVSNNKWHRVDGAKGSSLPPIGMDLGEEKSWFWVRIPSQVVKRETWASSTSFTCISTRHHHLSPLEVRATSRKYSSQRIFEVTLRLSEHFTS